MTIKRTPRDPIQLGKLMVDIATGVVPDAVDDGKDATAATAGRKGVAGRTASLTLSQASFFALLAVSGVGCAPQQDACASSGYDPNVCADEQSRRAAVASFLLNRPQPQPYVLPMPQAPQQTPVRNCNSLPNGTGGYYTTFY